MERVADRVSILIQALGVSKNEFARKAGISSALISKITTKQSNFGVELIEKIVGAYPKVNVEWLVLGEGEMFESLDEVQLDTEQAVERAYGKIVNIIELTEKLVGTNPAFDIYLKEILDLSKQIRGDHLLRTRYYRKLKEALELEFDELFHDYFLKVSYNRVKELKSFDPPRSFLRIRVESTKRVGDGSNKDVN